jgi:RNA polymerase subunit RPABC4/transcription elongation factor Spt4
MGMIPCPECKKEISETADTCPNCGYQLTPEKIADIKKEEQQIQKGCGIGCLSVIVIFVILYMIDSFSSEPKTKEETRKEQIEKHFSAWDGSHRGLTELIKKSMNDPGSYEYVETVYWDKGDHLIVKTTFRGKNVFGGVVKNWVMAKVDLNGNVIEIISQGP